MKYRLFITPYLNRIGVNAALERAIFSKYSRDGKRYILCTTYFILLSYEQ